MTSYGAVAVHGRGGKVGGDTDLGEEAVAVAHQPLDYHAGRAILTRWSVVGPTGHT
jgi:hypothetical protein